MWFKLNILILILMASLFAFSIGTPSFLIHSFNMGLAGSKPETANLTIRYTLTNQQPSTNKMATADYNGNLGWFSLFYTIVPPIPPSGYQAAMRIRRMCDVPFVSSQYGCIVPLGYGH